MRRTLLLSIVLLSLIVSAGCSSSPPETKSAPVASPYGPGPATVTNGKHPLAKYVELSGFRLTRGAGDKLTVKFAAINHSDADLEELGVHVRVTTTVAKPGDPPVTEFDAKVPPLGPEEVHDITLAATTPLKSYEMPDWQFLRADFDITSPAP